MEKRIVSPPQPGTGLPTATPPPASGFVARKHAKALNNAQALLAVDPPGLFDQLNCGKFGKLIDYIRTGLPGLLLIACYGECAFPL
jgi:hypothetical protein